eukprot:TRINITY_DN47183_c0_g1_i1.p2 TRINITY_DN47183_c0_g1~~TRINITY_DN47183_c0_g1_i1.p2  ORF type:complete len:210 (-),score=120.66 TRINITY_DN47183_c0_g1_i1:5-634(-)
MILYALAVERKDLRLKTAGVVLGGVVCLMFACVAIYKMMTLKFSNFVMVRSYQFVFLVLNGALAAGLVSVIAINLHDYRMLAAGLAYWTCMTLYLVCVDVMRFGKNYVDVMYLVTIFSFNCWRVYNISSDRQRLDVAMLALTRDLWIWYASLIISYNVSLARIIYYRLRNPSLSVFNAKRVEYLITRSATSTRPIDEDNEHSDDDDKDE